MRGSSLNACPLSRGQGRIRDVDAFDLLVYSPSNQPLIAVEVKKTVKELDQMLGAMKNLERTGMDLRCDQGRLSNADKKFRGLLAIRPEFFLAVAPGVERHYQVCYRLDLTPKTAELIPIERVPTAVTSGSRRWS